MDINKQELNIPNFIEIFLDKLFKNLPFYLTRKEFNKRLIEKNQRVLLKFAANKICLEQTDEKSIEQEYRNVLYLNNSITNENYFCLAYNNDKNNKEYNDKSINAVALILYAENVEIIDDVIREYAFNVSLELNLSSPDKETVENDFKGSEQHTCVECPMKQFVDLCEFLNSEQNDSEQILFEIINKNLDFHDQIYLYDSLNEKNLDMNTYDDPIENLQLTVALIHKLCQKRQKEHLIFNFKQKNNLVEKNSEKKFQLMKKQSEYNLSNLTELKSPEKKNLQRRNTIHSVESTNLLGILEKSTSNVNFLKENKKKENYVFNIPNFPSFSKNIKKINNQNVITLPRKNSMRRSLYSKIVGPSNSNTCPNISENLELNNEYHIINFEGNTEKWINLGGRFKSKSDIRQFWKKV